MKTIINNQWLHGLKVHSEAYYHRVYMLAPKTALHDNVFQLLNIVSGTLCSRMTLLTSWNLNFALCHRNGLTYDTPRQLFITIISS